MYNPLRIYNNNDIVYVYNEYYYIMVIKYRKYRRL